MFVARKMYHWYLGKVLANCMLSYDYMYADHVWLLLLASNRCRPNLRAAAGLPRLRMPHHALLSPRWCHLSLRCSFCVFCVPPVGLWKYERE